jgi:GntR family transcriptional repressor for pyruvate dehydrogenase complex
LRSTHNPLVIRVGETIMELFKVSIGYAVRHHPEIALRDHKKILEAFCQKNKPKLRKVIQGSFEAWKHGLEAVNCKTAPVASQTQQRRAK